MAEENFQKESEKEKKLAISFSSLFFYQ